MEEITVWLNATSCIIYVFTGYLTRLSAVQTMVRLMLTF
jgi:hypothetical protein